MIDPAKLRWLLVASAILSLAAAAGALLAGSPAWAGGLGVGYLLGAVPFASWAWIATRGLSSPRNRVLAVLLGVAKLGLYAGALYLTLRPGGVAPAAILVGMTGVIGVVTAGALRGPRAREAA